MYTYVAWRISKALSFDTFSLDVRSARQHSCRPSVSFFPVSSVFAPQRINANPNPKSNLNPNSKPNPNSYPDPNPNPIALTVIPTLSVRVEL